MGLGCNGLGWGHGMGWGGGWAGMILGLALLAGMLVVVGLGAAWAIRHGRRGRAGGSVAANPLEIARRRLAAGEITVEEFERIRQVLRGEG